MFTVLIADDSKIVRERLVELLAEQDELDVIGTAGDTAQAIRAAQELKPDALVLDIRMPGGGGMPVLAESKTTAPERVVLVLTSYPFPEFRDAYLAAGADHFFDKTQDMEAMTDVLVNLARQHNFTTNKDITHPGDKKSEAGL